MIDKLREYLIDLAHKNNQTLGQMIFVSGGLAMLACSVFSLAILYVAVLATVVSLAVLFKDDLRS